MAKIYEFNQASEKRKKILWDACDALRVTLAVWTLEDGERLATLADDETNSTMPDDWSTLAEDAETLSMFANDEQDSIMSVEVLAWSGMPFFDENKMRNDFFYDKNNWNGKNVPMQIGKWKGHKLPW